MLIKRAVLDRIVTGEIDVLFRRWRRPTVKANGTLHTSVGLLSILSIDVIAPSRVEVSDAKRAGYHSRRALLDELEKRGEGSIHRIEVRYAGPDPRIALRSNPNPSDAELDELRARLDRMDAAAGPWTRTTLSLIGAHPHVRAEELAELAGSDKPTFKNRVRRLKALGLTISHSPGYEISPLGRALLDTLD